MARPVMPTLYFVGVTTEQSSIQQLFPLWANQLGIQGRLVGHDIALNASPAAYRQCVERIRDDPDAVGALVTTHKAAVYDHARHLFADLDRYAELCREVSCIGRDAAELMGFAKDPITAGLAMDHMFETAGPAAGRHVVCFGAGGAGIAITARLLSLDESPARLVVVDRDPHRIALARDVHAQLPAKASIEYYVHSEPEANDAILAASPNGSFIINATGLGKDLPGSPVSRRAVFAPQSLVWDLNYRGDLEFLATARGQAREAALQIHDGWRYFLHGWAEVIGEVFDIEMTTERFQDLANAAEPLRDGSTTPGVRT
jgi:shikimate dehydrogenase